MRRQTWNHTGLLAIMDDNMAGCIGRMPSSEELRSNFEPGAWLKETHTRPGLLAIMAI